MAEELRANAQCYAIIFKLFLGIHNHQYRVHNMQQ